MPYLTKCKKILGIWKMRRMNFGKNLIISVLKLIIIFINQNNSRYRPFNSDSFFEV